MTWQVEVQGDEVWVYRPMAIAPDKFDADGAWDLADDLLIAADRIWMATGAYTEVEVTLGPAWTERIHVNSDGGPPYLWCEVCDTEVQHIGLGYPLDKVFEFAREHWISVHSAEVDVSEDADLDK